MKTAGGAFSQNHLNLGVKTYLNGTLHQQHRHRHESSRNRSRSARLGRRPVVSPPGDRLFQRLKRPQAKAKELVQGYVRREPDAVKLIMVDALAEKLDNIHVCSDDRI